MTSSRDAVWRPVLIAVVVVVVSFVAATRGLDRWYAGQDRPTEGRLHVPAVLHDPPPSAPTVDDRGPVGPVAAVVAVAEVSTGLNGEVENPWVAVSGLDGAYRALDEPGLPVAGAGLMRVAPDGRTLAWAEEDRVVLYDPVADEPRRIRMAGPARIGAFSPDGSRLLVHDGALRALRVETGELDGRVDASQTSVGRAAWTADGTGVTFVEDRELVTASMMGGPAVRQPTDLPMTSTFAWAPSGERLVSLEGSGGEMRLWRRAADGLLEPSGAVRGTGVYVDRLVGFTDDDRLAVIALTLETGTISRLFEVGTDGVGAQELSLLPSAGGNWAGEETVEWAGDAVAGGSARFPAPTWPWRDSAILVALIVVTGFGLGMFLTRKRVRRRWLRWRRRRAA